MGLDINYKEPVKNVRSTSIMNNCKYTFLLPAYKAEYIKEAIDSLLAQTYMDFCVIVSDDNSPENIRQIVDSFNDDRIEYRRNNDNIGGLRLVEHWNLLLSLCDTEYVIVASDDDVYCDTFLENIDRLTKKYPNINVFRARTQRIDYDNEVTSIEDIFEEYQDAVSALHSMFCGNYIGCIGNYVFCTEALKRAGGFADLPYAWFSDMQTVISMQENGQVNTGAVLFSFRLSDINISNTKQNKKVDFYKLKATILFDRWLSSYITHLPANGCVLSTNYIKGTISNFKHRIYSQCGDYSWSIPIIKWYRDIFIQLKKHEYFSLHSFLKYFIISVINRIHG